MKQKVVIVAAMILSVILVFGGYAGLKHLGTSVINYPKLAADILVHAPDGSKYYWGNVLKEIGSDIGFSFLWAIPQVVKIIINYSGDARLNHSECVTTVDKLIYLIQETVIFFQDPYEYHVSEFESGHQGSRAITRLAA